MQIDGSSVLVTGANRGLGLVIVEALLARGAARVYAGARDPATLDEARERLGDRVVPVRLDVTSPADVRAVAGACPGPRRPGQQRRPRAGGAGARHRRGAVPGDLRGQRLRPAGAGARARPGPAGPRRRRAVHQLADRPGGLAQLPGLRREQGGAADAGAGAARAARGGRRGGDDLARRVRRHRHGQGRALPEGVAAGGGRALAGGVGGRAGGRVPGPLRRAWSSTPCSPACARCSTTRSG